MGNLQQPDQGLPSDGPRCQCCLQDLGEEHCRIEGEDHLEQTHPGGKGFCESPKGATQAPQRGFLNSQHFLCQQDTLLSHTESQDMLHSSEPSGKQDCPRDIQSVQGDLSVLSPSWFSHYNHACR